MYKFRRRTRVKMVVYIKCQEKQTPLVKIFLSPAPYIKPTEVICEGAQREVFDLIQDIDSKRNQQRKPILDGVLYHRGAMGITIDIPLFLSQKNPLQRPQKGYKQ